MQIDPVAISPFGHLLNERSYVIYYRANPNVGWRFWDRKRHRETALRNARKAQKARGGQFKVELRDELVAEYPRRWLRR